MVNILTLLLMYESVPGLQFVPRILRKKVIGAGLRPCMDIRYRYGTYLPIKYAPKNVVCTRNLLISCLQETHKGGIRGHYYFYE